jgi:hypothetical protein
MSNQISFCAEEHSKPEILELIKKILLIPDLYNEVQKYLASSEAAKENQLKKLKKRAFQKWHPDINKDPQAEAYAKCIDEALDSFKLICENPEYFIDPVSQTIHFQEQEPEEPITKIQEKLRNNLESIFKKARKTTETIEVDKGTLYSEIIEEEQQSRIYEISLYALMFYGIIGGIITGITETTLLYYPVAIIYGIVLCICAISIIPFSRYWLFSKVPYLYDVQIIILNSGSFLFEKFMNWAGQSMAKNIKPSNFIIVAPCIVLYLWIKFLLFIFGFIMYLLYEVAFRVAGSQRFKAIKQTQIFYDGVADWYIYEILAKPEDELTEQEKQIIFYFYKEYTND